MKVRWSSMLVLVAAVGLLVQAGSRAEDKKKPAPAKGLVVNGELTDSDVKDKVRTESYCKVFTFKMVKDTTYQIDMKSTDLDSYLRLEDPKGKQVAYNDDGGGFPDARIVFKATESGDYRIIATTFGGGKTGKFTLTARDKDAAVPVGKAIDLKNDKGKATYTGSIADDDPLYNGKKHKLFTFAMEAGKTYQIDHVSGAFDAFLYLESPDGKVLARDDDGGEGLNSRITYRAEKAGRYRVIATSLSGQRTGDFTLTVQEK